MLSHLVMKNGRGQAQPNSGGVSGPQPVGGCEPTVVHSGNAIEVGLDTAFARYRLRSRAGDQFDSGHFDPDREYVAGSSCTVGGSFDPSRPTGRKNDDF